MKIRNSRPLRQSVCLLCVTAVLFIARYGTNAQNLRGADSLWSVVSEGKRQKQWTRFPSLDETMEMARLSSAVYSFAKKRKNNDDDDKIPTCETYRDDYGTRCEWYLHDYKLGTQVMIVTNTHAKYIAVVYAGTDDVRTTLEDVDVRRKKFGDSTVELPPTTDPELAPRIHAGFNDAVFDHDIWRDVYSRVRRLRIRHPFLRLWTTGHSLGAANSMLTAVGLAVKGYTVTNVNFGCPQTGNKDWQAFFQDYVASSNLADRLGVWRVVLGADIVPRMPDFFFHGGHTIQLWSDSHHHKKDDDIHPVAVEAYYNHAGDEERGYAGVPCGWAKWSHIWNPQSVIAHHIDKYIEFLTTVKNSTDMQWVSSFATTDDGMVDDDQYVNPPDDVYRMDYFSDRGPGTSYYSSSRTMQESPY